MIRGCGTAHQPKGYAGQVYVQAAQWLAVVKKCSLSSFMIATSFDDWPDQAYTMAWLSQWNLTRRFARRGPHTLAAATIANSSCP